VSVKAFVELGRGIIRIEFIIGKQLGIKKDERSKPFSI
jgi:hypothetical protein